MNKNEIVSKKAMNRLAKRNFTKKRMRNIFLILAVSLVTLLLTVMFGAGISIIENVETADLRLKGSTANAFLYEADDQEMEKVAELSEISRIGWQYYIASVTPKDELSNQNVIAMTGYDDTEWKKNIIPTITNLNGSYPEKENEIMVSEWTLKKLGIDSPQIGMRIPISFTTLSGDSYQQDFILSGFYTDYIYRAGVTPNSGNTMAANLYYMNHGSNKRAAGNIVVSDLSAEKYLVKEGRLGTCFIDDSLNNEEALNLLKEQTGQNHIVVAGLTKNPSQSFSLASIPFLAVLLVVISGYLLIYNVMNISVIQEMHMYGQLKTLGATKKQLKKLIRKQANYISWIGIPVGLVLGTVFAIFVIPGLLERLTVGSGFGGALTNDISISPWLYVFSSLFSYFTVYISCRKPAKLAAKVSPIEALRYTEVQENINSKRSRKGTKLYCMAFRNVFRNKKRAILTFSSMFFGLLIFFVISTSTYGVNYDIKLEREQPYSFTLKNLSFQTDDYTKIEDTLNGDVQSQIQSWNGVSDINTEYVDYAVFKEPVPELAPWIQQQAIERNLAPQNISDDLQAMVAGLSIEQLNRFSYETIFDKSEIEKHLNDGTGIFLAEADSENTKSLCGKTITLSGSMEGDLQSSYVVLGVLTTPTSNRYVENYNYYGSDNGQTVKCYTSFQGIERLTKSPIVHSLQISVDEGTDEKISNQLLDLFASADTIGMTSQLESKAMVDDGVQIIRIAGKVIGIFLIVMGLLNFINVIFTNIYARQKELAALESIGMTQKQLKTVLILEGLYYSIITIGLLLTIGLLVSKGVFVLIQNVIYFVEYGIPYGSILILFMLMLLICTIIPLIVYKSIAKESIVERLRRYQD